jgi:hypothetical protein
VPQSVRDRFTQDGHRFYFPDGAPAFRDHGRKLSSSSENTEVIHSLVEIARSRGWQDITVGGTERFRQEAWRQARLAGLTVRGYKPSEAERASVIRALSRRDEVASAEGSPPPTDPNASRPPTTPGPDPRRRGEPIVGKLLDHGRESFRFDPHEEMSYFVRLATPSGERTIWGKDLERAVHDSLTQPQIGDQVALARTGAQNVTVKRRERNAAGEVLSERELTTHKNRWVVEKTEFFEERAAAAAVLRDSRVEAREAVKERPQLAGTYVKLKAAEIAAQRIRDPQDQARFVGLVRGALADAVARGEPLEPVRLRDRSQPPRRVGRQDRELEPARARA